MLPVTWATVRLFLHVLAASVWVGGQITLAGLVPGLRGLGADAPRTVARRFNLIAWPAFGVLIVTGIWNIAAVKPTWGTSYTTTLMVKTRRGRGVGDHRVRALERTIAEGARGVRRAHGRERAPGDVPRHHARLVHGRVEGEVGDHGEVAALTAKHVSPQRTRR